MVGALTILLSAFNWYGYAHHMFRLFIYGITPPTIVHWLSAAALMVILLYVARSGPRPDANSNPTGSEETTAEIPELPGVMVYGAARREAQSKVEALALQVVADRI
jgi:hypothetical protein